MSHRWPIAALVALLLSAPLVAYAGCKWDLPSEVFEYFHETSAKADCNNYEYKFADLKGEKPYAIIVSQYERSCDNRYCDTEIFEKRGSTWVHIATVPGRVKVVETKTNGYHDILTLLLGRLYLYVWDGTTYLDMIGLAAASEQMLLLQGPNAATPQPVQPEQSPTPRPNKK